MRPGGYTISEAAEKLGVSAGWLRFGERLGSFPEARRTPGGQRRYTDEDIAMLKELGVGERAAWIRERAKNKNRS